MSRKSVIKRVGSIVLVVAMLTSVITVTSVNKATGTESTANVMINEIMYNPASGNEWIELFNAGDTDINLTGWTIKDAADNTFGDLTNVVVPAGKCVFIENTGVAILNNDEDTIHLYDDAMAEVDNVTYNDTMGADGNGKTLEYNPVTTAWEESRVDGGTPGGRNSVLWPDVTVDYPNGGTIGGMLPVQWTATSPQGLDLTIKIEYKNDTATDWSLVAENEENDGSYTWDITGLDAAEKYMVKITATDTMGDSWFDISPLFNITPLTVTPKTANYNETKTVDVTGSTGTVNLWYPIHSIWPSGYGLKDSRDGSGGSARFSNVVFNTTGNWVVEDQGSNSLFYILVKPIELAVTVNPTEFTYTKTTEGWITVNGTVSQDDTLMKGVTVEIWPPGQTPGIGTPIKTDTTDANGEYEMTDVGILNYGAGIYNITARIGAFGMADAFGYTTMVVNAGEANVSLYSQENVKGGFPEGEIVFAVTFPDGDALLPMMQEYNISVWKDGELFDWYNTSDGSTGNNITFAAPYGKYVNLTPVDVWETGDDYTFKVFGDYKGSSAWEYIGETSFEISPPPNVNVFVSPDKMDVEDYRNGTNIQPIEIKIYGENIHTFGNYSNLGIEEGTNKNVTDRIKIWGDILYSPPADAYSYNATTNTWTVNVFPTTGDGTIHIDITWPDKGTASATIAIEDGGNATVSPTSIIVDKETTVTVTVIGRNGDPAWNANVTLYYENGTYGIGDMVPGATIEGDGTTGKGQGGEFVFTNLVSDRANTNIIVTAQYLSAGVPQYAYAVLRSEAAHDLNTTITPTDVLAGEHTKFAFNITKDGKPYGSLEFYIMNATELAKFHEDYNELTGMISPTEESKGNYTYYGHFEEGTYYLYVRTPDEKHDNLNKEPSFEVTKATVTPNPPKLVKYADVNKTVEFTVTWNGEPLNGTLRAWGITETGSYEAYVDEESYVDIDIKNGKGNLTNVTARHLGDVTFEFMPEADHSVFAEADGKLPVVAPEITVTPETVLLFEENLITLTVKHPVTGKGIEGLTVWADITGAERELGKTDENGKLTIGIVPLQTGYITLSVGDDRDPAGNISVWIGLKVQVLCTCGSNITLRKGTELTILVTTRGGSPVEGATVKVKGTTIGKTDANGEIKYKFEETGTYTITAEKSDYITGSKTVKIKIEKATTPGFEMMGLVLGALAALLLIRRRRK